MRIAFVDCLSVGGGLSRFSLLLCRSLIENYPFLTIDYFVHSLNLDHIPEIKNIERVKIKVLKSSMPLTQQKKLKHKLVQKFLKSGSNMNVIEEIEKRIRDYDLAYFPSAHMMKRPNLSIPVVGTIHDFNWKYFFGRQNFNLAFVEMMDTEILNWLNRSVNICSSQDVVDEALKLYPSARNLPIVVHIAPVVVHAVIPEDRISEILRDLQIDFPYIIFPGNFVAHKNHLNLFTAFSLLKKRKGFASYKLILTGLNSDQVKRGIAEERGVQLLTGNSESNDFDVMGLGYRSNEVIDVLISKARLLVSPSVYEAICTPAMDAWSFGTPTAISDIPPFREHEKAWGIRTAFFNPMDPRNMADVMETYLNNYDEAQRDGKISKTNMAKYTWKHVAEGYMKIFQQAKESS